MRVITIMLLLGSLEIAASPLPAFLARAQNATPTPDTVQKSIALQPFTCVTAHPGEWVTFDWNPGFRDAGVMHGIGLASLNLSPVRDNAQIAGPAHVNLGGISGSGSRTEDIGNGFFRLQFVLPTRITNGDYLVTGAVIQPRMVDDYGGPPMEMTHHPRDQHFCITVAKPAPPTTPSEAANSPK